MKGERKKMNKSAKMALIVTFTVIGAIALVLLIAFMPACSNTVKKDNNETVVDVPDTAVESGEYEDMSKDELVQLVKEKDAEIKKLEEQLEIYTDISDVKVGIPSGGSVSSSGSGSSSSGSSSVGGSSSYDEPSYDEPSGGVHYPSTDEPDSGSGYEPSIGGTGSSTDDSSLSDTGL